MRNSDSFMFVVRHERTVYRWSNVSNAAETTATHLHRALPR